MALRNLTNSPLDSPRQHRQTQLSPEPGPLLGSDDSDGFPSLDFNDSICNAVRITSVQNSSSCSASEFGRNLNTGTIVGQAFDQAPPPETRTEVKDLAANCANTKIITNKHRRGWSLNDLDCLGKVHLPLQETLHQRSTSSKEALEALKTTTSYPHLPVKPPPCRRSTPDGIPSFRTLEAQRLRLANPSWLYRLGDLIFGRSSHTQEPEQVVDDIPNPPGTNQASFPSVQHHQYQSPTEILRRASGMTRPTSTIDISKKPRKSSLPKGVRKALLPGDLAMAADGSHVRGRFGPRVSGHGVGQRTIDVHPLARRRGTSTIEEEVHAINKACDRELQREQYQPSTEPRGSSPLQQNRRHHLNAGQFSDAEPVLSNGTCPLHISDDQRQQNVGTWRSSQTAPHPRSIRSSFTRAHPLLSRTQNRQKPISGQIDCGVEHILSSESEVIHSQSMPEPGPYDTSSPQNGVFHGDPLVISAADDMADGLGQNSGPAEGNQSRNLKMEIEIC